VAPRAFLLGLRLRVDADARLPAGVKDGRGLLPGQNNVRSSGVKPTGIKGMEDTHFHPGASGTEYSWFDGMGRVTAGRNQLRAGSRSVLRRI
jgi:hypothetical protein